MVRRAAGVALALVVALLLVASTAWEVSHPSVPTSYELSLAAKWATIPTWLGRAILAGIGASALYALYTFMRSTGGPRIAVYALVVLSTSPAWFLHARVMTGAVVSMACFAVVLSGFGVACFDTGRSGTTRLLGLVLASAAAGASLLGARVGLPSRGLAAILGLPALAVGLAGLSWRHVLDTPSRRARPKEPSRTACLVAVTVGVFLLGASLVACTTMRDSALSVAMLGARASAFHVSPTSASAFDAPTRAIAYGLIPWSPLVPFALARRATSPVHLSLMLASIFGVLAHAAASSVWGDGPIVSTVAIAGSVAAMLDALDDSRPPAAVLVIALLGLGWLVAHDFVRSPERMLVAFGMQGAPGARADASTNLTRAALFEGIAFVVRAALISFALLTSFALLVPRRWLPFRRGCTIALAGLVLGATLRTNAYAKMIERTSWGSAFDAFTAHRRPNDALGTLGLDRRTLTSTIDAVPLKDARAAMEWLARNPSRPMAPDIDSAAAANDLGPPSSQHFLAFDAAELAGLNAEHRRVARRNLFVLAGREANVMLAATFPLPDVRSENPLDAIVLDEAPPNIHPIGAILGDRIEVVGVELMDRSGSAVDHLSRHRRRGRVRVTLRARAMTTPQDFHAVCTFLHIDHSPSRFSDEHRALPYPMHLWQEGDVILDDFDVDLPAHFHAGIFRMFWGIGILPCDNDRRIAVTAGPSDGNHRVPLGALELR